MTLWIPKDSKLHASIAQAEHRLKDSLPGTLDRVLHMLHAAQDAACLANDDVYEFIKSNAQMQVFKVFSNKQMR